jgi:branched-chain amino acid transport system ATP-binding protein
LANPLLEIIGLDVFYGDAQAIWEVSFHVESEKIVALVGANGAGKTTLLNTISAVRRAKKGKILFQGELLAHSRPEEIVSMGISHVPEGRRLFSRLTVLENLELGAFPARVRPFSQESLDRAFDLFPVLKHRIRQSAGSLSGGEQQMLAIARAIMARPVLLMLDEPSLGLAPVMVRLMFQIIQTLNRDGATVLLVEQNVQQTLEIAGYVYVLKTGKMELEGRGQDLIRNSDFQRAYLGMMG